MSGADVLRHHSEPRRSPPGVSVAGPSGVKNTDTRHGRPMIHSAAVPGFSASRCGFPFSNWFPPHTPVFELPTPFGTIPLGDAHDGLCGGMVFAAMDLHHHGITDIPDEPTRAVRAYFARRLMASLGLPFGVLKYFDWQRRPTATRRFGGARLIDGTRRKTILEEWPRIRAQLDAGLPVSLGLVKVAGWNFRRVAENHQVLTYGYTFDDATETVTLRQYDPNHPGDDEAALTFTLTDPDGDAAIAHSAEGPIIRGLFVTEYRPLPYPPRW